MWNLDYEFSTLNTDLTALLLYSFKIILAFNIA